ncbi:hypothetical protein F4703DRAFT_1550496 [Phycomyces blakesleeanus]
MTDTTISRSIETVLKIVNDISPRIASAYQTTTRNELILVGGAALFSVYNLVQYIKDKSTAKYYLPPRVPFALPLVGHSLYLLWDSNQFIDWCAKKYGEVYEISIMGKIVTVASGLSGQEALKADTDFLSLEEGVIKDVLYLQYAIDKTTFEIGFYVNPVVAKAVISHKKVPRHTEGILKGMDAGFKNLLPATDSFVLKDPNHFFQRLIAHMSVPTLIGKEVGDNATVIESFAAFTADVTDNIPIFMSVPVVFHRFITPYLQSFKRHRVVMSKFIAPVVESRRQAADAAKLKGETYKAEDDFLQGLLEFVKPDGTNYTADQVAQATLLVAFASVHTTATNLAFCAYWIVSRPDIKQAILEEIESVVGKDINTELTYEHFENMPYLDKVIRESVRQGADVLAVGKKCLKTFTFSNGYQVPAGRVVETTNRRLNMGLSANRVDISEMDPLESGSRPPTTASRDYVTFGMGKHLCPGRFFAVLEIKLTIIQLLRQYDITPSTSSPAHPVKLIGGFMATNSSAPIRFTKRKL